MCHTLPGQNQSFPLFYKAFCWAFSVFSQDEDNGMVHGAEVSANRTIAYYLPSRIWIDSNAGPSTFSLVLLWASFSMS